MLNFICEICEKNFKLNSSLRRHIRLNHDGPSSSFYCSKCNLHFGTHQDLQRHLHLIEHPENNNVFCNVCNKHILKSIWHYHLRTNTHKKK